MIQINPKFFRKTLLGISSFLFIGCESGIPLVGLDERGASRFFQITDEKYSEQMGSLTTQMHTAVEKGMSNKNPVFAENSWAIHTIAVGVGVVAQIDTLPLYFSIEPRIRFIFTDKGIPALPATP